MSNISSIARSCGIKTLLFFSIIAFSFWFVAMISNNWPAVVSSWRVVLFATSFGGEFWGAVTSSLTGAMMAAWVLCIALSSLIQHEDFKKGKGDVPPPFAESGKKTFFIFLAIFFLGILLWLVGFISSQSIFMDMSNADAYHRAAFIATCIPAVLFFIIFISALIVAMQAFINILK